MAMMAMALSLSNPAIVTRVDVVPTVPNVTSTSVAAISGCGKSAPGRRYVFSGCIIAALAAVSVLGPTRARAAILEADEDFELLDRVKKDRQKRIERQGLITSSNKETGYLQELVYKLNRVGQAIEKNDFSAAVDVLGPNMSPDLVKNVNTAFTKLSSGPDEKTEVEAFNSSFDSLIKSVGKLDVESSRAAFVSSASALEKWISLTGLAGQIKGL